MKTVANRLDLGITRIAGYNLYDEVKKDFQETTPKEVKDLINQGKINGLKLENGNIELDGAFNMSNIMIKSAVGKYRTLFPTASIVSCMYAVVRVIETDNDKLYEIISNKCARFKFKAEQLKGLIEIGGYVAGVKMVNGEIEVCEGVTFEDRRNKSEQIDNSSNTKKKEAKASIDEGIQEKQDLTVIKTEVKSDEAVIVDGTASTEKVNSLDVTFDTLDVIKLADAFVVTADDKYLNTDDTAENKDDKLEEVHIDEKKLVTNKKTKRK